MARGLRRGPCLTKDRRYESKDSRVMENGSMSPTLLLVSVEARDEMCLGSHCALSSVGDGCIRAGQHSGLDRWAGMRKPMPAPKTRRLTGRYTPLSLTTILGR